MVTRRDLQWPGATRIYRKQSHELDCENPLFSAGARRTSHQRNILHSRGQALENGAPSIYPYPKDASSHLDVGLSRLCTKNNPLISDEIDSSAEWTSNDRERERTRLPRMGGQISKPAEEFKLNFSLFAIGTMRPSKGGSCSGRLEKVMEFQELDK